MTLESFDRESFDPTYLSVLSRTLKRQRNGLGASNLLLYEVHALLFYTGKV